MYLFKVQYPIPGFRYYGPYVAGHIYYLQTYGITQIYTTPLIPLSFGSYVSHIFHCLLLRELLFLPHPTHPMSSSNFSSPGHSIYNQNAHGSLFLLSHTHKDHNHISIPLEHLTGRQAPLTINLTLALTLPFAYFSFLVDSSCVHTVVVSYLCRNHSSTVSCHTPGVLSQSLLPPISVIFHSKHSHSFLINIPKP